LSIALYKILAKDISEEMMKAHEEKKEAKHNLQGYINARSSRHDNQLPVFHRIYNRYKDRKNTIR